MKKEKNILGGKLKLVTVKLTVHNIKSLINMVEIEKINVDNAKHISLEEKLRAIMYLELIIDKLKEPLK